MHKPLILTLAGCLALTGCQLFQKSSTWSVVKNVPPPIETTSDGSREYAQAVHLALEKADVEHKIVVYRFEPARARRVEGVERTAVIYKDDTHPANPWWLTDGDRAGRPLWLPNDTVEKQLAFYIKGNVQVLDEIVFFPGGYRKDEPRIANERPVAVTYIVPPSAKPEPTAIVEPAPEPPKRPIYIRVLETLRLKRRPPEPEPAPAPAPYPAAAPATKKPLASTSAPAPSKAAKTNYKELFRKKHGAKYDPKSASDRKKMAKLKAAH